MAAAFCELARALGYDAHQMSGYVPSSSGGLTEHSWVEIDQNGATYVCDPDFVYDMARKGRVVNGYMFAYRTSGTWMYTRYYRMS